MNTVVELCIVELDVAVLLVVRNCNSSSCHEEELNLLHNLQQLLHRPNNLVLLGHLELGDAPEEESTMAELCASIIILQKTTDCFQNSKK